MNKRQRGILIKLMDCCNKLGGNLDGTATHESKYKDRQKANMLTYKVLYAVLCDRPNNEYSEQDYEVANDAIKKMQELTEKNYPDKNGNSC